MEATNIAHVVDIAEEKARYDTEVKNVLSDKYILAWIVSGVVKGLPIETIMVYSRIRYTVTIPRRPDMIF